MDTAATERLMTVRELADVLAVPESWIYGHTAARDIPTVRVGRYVRFRLSEVLTWLRGDGR